MIVTLPINSWQSNSKPHAPIPLNSATSSNHATEKPKATQTTTAMETTHATDALENGSVLYLPNLPFLLEPAEKNFLTIDCLKKKSKNISFNAKENHIKGSKLQGDLLEALRNMMARFHHYSIDLIHQLCPEYQSHLIVGRTSFRPAEIKGRHTSIRQDDTRLHVDAFPATPNQGNRILRVFSNINPLKARVWNLGEPFETVFNKFKDDFKKPLWGYRTLLKYAGITKSYRTLYDHYMLQLHDQMKLNQQYQDAVKKQEFHFKPGTTWIVMTDSVSHAALSGQHLLEQTFYLPVKAMVNPKLAPFSILQRHFSW